MGKKAGEAIRATYGNPFGTSRVDTPFQDHPDFEAVFASQYKRLKSIIHEIAADPNHQTRGVILAGEPGSGKTHLIMRLTKDVIKSNRILFIRQPNNPDAILFHIYTRIIESLVEKVPGTPYTQIEYLLAKSFSKIFINDVRQTENPSAKRKTIAKSLAEDPLNLYRRIGAEGTAKRRKNWAIIEKRIQEWWGSNRGWGVGGTILKAFIKYCSYYDFSRREIIRRWLTGAELSSTETGKTGIANLDPETGLETFAMEAMQVLGRLAVQDQPLIIAFDQLEGLKYNELLLQRFGDCIKELFTHVPGSLIIFNFFPDRWAEYAKTFDESTIQRMARDTVFLDRVSAEQMEKILRLRAGRHGVDINAVFSEKEIGTITGSATIREMLNMASDYFRFHRDGIPLPRQISGFKEEVRSEIKALKEEVAQLKAYLNMEMPTFDRQRETDRVKTVLRSYEAQIRDEQNDNIVISDSDDAGKFDTILRALDREGGMKMSKFRYGVRKLPPHVLVRGANGKKAAAGFLHRDGNAFSARIDNFNSIVKLNPGTRFVVFRDQKVPAIRSEKGLSGIKTLDAFENGRFRIMDAENRLTFETLYRLVTDIQNRDLDLEPDKAADALRHIYKTYWLIEFLEALQKT